MPDGNDIMDADLWDIKGQAPIPVCPMNRRTAGLQGDGRRPRHGNFSVDRSSGRNTFHDGIFR